MIILAILKYVPADLFLKINSQIGSPRARNIDTKIAENKMLDFIEKLIFECRIDLSFTMFLSISFDCSLIDGIMVTASELIRVDGIIKRGNVIPMIIPNSDNASA